MIRMFILCAFLSGTAIGQSNSTVTVHDPEAEERKVPHFKGLDVGGAFEVFLSPGEESKVVVSASDGRYTERIRTEVVDGILHIDFDGKGVFKWPKNLRLRAYVSFRTLGSLRAHGAAKVNVNGVIAGERFKVDLSGASSFRGAVDVGVLSSNQSGASDARYSGKAGEARFDLSGASDVKAFDLTSQICRIEASGASDAQVSVARELQAQANGASGIQYKGSPALKDTRSTGASSIRRSAE